MIANTIPYGWRKLIPGDIQQADDWYYDEETWKVNPQYDVGRLFNPRSCFNMIRRTNGDVDYNPNYSRRVFDNPNDAPLANGVSFDSNTIPFGWRKLSKNEIQSENDWWYCCLNGKWLKNRSSSIGIPLKDNLPHIRKIATDVTTNNSDLTTRVDTLVKENERLTRENNRISIELIDKTNELNNLRKSLRALV